MSRTVNVNEEFVVVSEGKKDTGKFAVLGDGGKFDTSVIPAIDELQEQITKEVTERTEGDKALQANIDTETSARISADQQLQGNIEAEATARDAADKDLEEKIAAEVTARTYGDTQLQANIEAEASTRTTADKDLQDQISKEITARNDGDTALQSSVDKEVAARTDADSKLQSSIDTEVDARTKADQGIQDQVDVLNKKNAFSNVVVNGATIQADSQEDTIELKAGTNIILNTDAADKKVTIAVDGKVASATAADTAAACTGNAATATKLATPVNINGVSFDGSADLTISSGVPTGAVQAFAMVTVPDGWLACDGSTVSRTDYANLFAAIGTAFGEGDSSTTFTLPNLQDNFVLGLGSTYATIAATGGEATHTLTADELAAHRHLNVVSSANNQSEPTSSNSIPRVNGYNGCHEQAVVCGDTGEPDVSRSSVTGSGNAHNNMPPYLILKYCIKY